MNGVGNHKTKSWVKHTVRRWKELYQDIQRINGQLTKAPLLSTIFRNEILTSKLKQTKSKTKENPVEPSTSRKKIPPHPQPNKEPTIKPPKNKARVDFSLKSKK